MKKSKIKKEKDAGKALTKRKESKKNKKAAAGGDFYIVGIGASAGGLETLEKLFTAMPRDSGMAFVVIQHLSPTHKSIMAVILERYTAMYVKEITDGMKVEKNRVYLNPPGFHVAIHDMKFTLSQISGDPVKMPVDYFLRSLADEILDCAICIILSGTASDGTLGIKAVKGKGGIVIVQDPETAKYDGMPRSAASTGLADFILPVEQIPEVLLKYVKHPFINITDKIAVRENLHFETQIQSILQLLKRATGHDFSHYKQTTINRRIERRLAVHQIDKLSDYVLYLQKYPEEISALFQDLIINVTSFFRDPAAFEALKNGVLPGFLKKKAQDADIRVWVVSCSTGEEAYSLAILISEVMEMFNMHFNVQIFATDIDQKSLETARKGIYPKSIEQDVSEERLIRFFVNDRGFYRVRKQIREMIVFSVHNVISDPPFSRLDIVSCRNLMIYMDDVLQEKILSLFRYSLNPEGILFLGTSESTGDSGQFFLTLNPAMKIFQRKGGHKVRKEYDHKKEGYIQIQKTEKEKGEDISRFLPDIQLRAEKLLLYEYGPSGALINASYEIIHFIGDTDKYLSPPRGKASFNILNMARDGLRERLAPALYKAVKEKKEVLAKEVLIKYHGATFTSEITVKPLDEPGLPQEFLLVIFNDKAYAKQKAEGKETRVKNKNKPDGAENLKKELRAVKEYLQSNIAQLETANEELKSANDAVRQRRASEHK